MTIDGCSQLSWLSSTASIVMSVSSVMDVKQFELEFRELLHRFTETNISNDENASESSSSLTNQQMIDVVQDVLNLKLNVSPADLLESLAATPDSGIVVTIPDAPDVPKPNLEYSQIVERNRSIGSGLEEKLMNPLNDDVLIGKSSSDFRAEQFVNTAKINVPGSNMLTAEKKAISKSTPDVALLIRSDTFVREDEFENVKNGDVFEKKNFDSLKIIGSSNGGYSTQNLTEVAKKLSVLKVSLTDVMNKIDDIQKTLPTESRPIRRLSAIGGFPGLNRASMTARPTQRPIQLRRSMLATFSGTPTSSRLSPEIPKLKNSNGKCKSTLNIPAAVDASKLVIPINYRSVSSGALTMSKNTIKRCSPAQKSQSVKDPKKLSSRSPSLSSLKIKARSGVQTVKSPVF